MAHWTVVGHGFEEGGVVDILLGGRSLATKGNTTNVGQDIQPRYKVWRQPDIPKLRPERPAGVDNTLEWGARVTVSGEGKDRRELGGGGGGEP